MVEVVTESMFGGTIFHRWMIQCEISRVLVLNLSGKTSGASARYRITTPLTPPSLLSRDTPAPQRSYTPGATLGDLITLKLARSVCGKPAVW
jgi:hypothetical protein